MSMTEQVARATRINEFFDFVSQRGGAVPLPTGDTAPKGDRAWIAAAGEERQPAA
jgi:hypothetical protein